MQSRFRSRNESSVKPAFNAGLTLYIASDSPVGDWLRLLLAEKDVESARARVLVPGEIDEDFMVLNPAQTLPTLADREGVITLPAVIAEYLDERYPHPPLMSGSPGQRATMRAAVHQLVSELLPAACGLENNAKRSLPAVLTTALREVERIPARSFLLGPEYTLVDAGWAVLLYRLLPVIGRQQPSSLLRYADMLFERPAFKRSFQ